MNIDEKFIPMLYSMGAGAITLAMSWGYMRAKQGQIDTQLSEIKTDLMATRRDQEATAQDLHMRITRHAKESEERNEKLNDVLTRLSVDIAEIKGYMRGSEK